MLKLLVRFKPTVRDGDWFIISAMFGLISWAILIAIFYFFPVLAIIGLFLAFILATILMMLYVVYKFALALSKI
ncbi:hypothetical protein IAE16_03710 [Hydrogenobacter sp. T-2]|uniref:hypothetical protein n=1 Tax=Pampinifervens diazotrophicum TaxID=1632018 RepID=UPI002B257E5E|nr:hypothetical protein [Hydrogenobacter sp. T-2]WPM32792.1 hypothetical protein IAE16_03710 [Hydrogenobacter sp. T-2]